MKLNAVNLYNTYKKGNLQNMNLIARCMKQSDTGLKNRWSLYRDHGQFLLILLYRYLYYGENFYILAKFCPPTNIQEICLHNLKAYNPHEIKKEKKKQKTIIFLFIIQSVWVSGFNIRIRCKRQFSECELVKTTSHEKKITCLCNYEFYL